MKTCAFISFTLWILFLVLVSSFIHGDYDDIRKKLAHLAFHSMKMHLKMFMTRTEYITIYNTNTLGKWPFSHKQICLL